jgi:hypothetical protein
MYKNPSSSLCSSNIVLNKAAVGGITPLTNKKIACSGGNFSRFLIT